MPEENNELNFNIPFRPVLDRSKDSEWYNANIKRLEDPEYSKRVGKSISKTYSTEEGRKKQSAKQHPQTEDAKEKIRLANLGKQRKGESWIQGMAEKQKGNTARCKPIVTPIGIFKSLGEAVEPTGISIGRLRKYTRTLPWSKEYYHISKEEYIMLTGKEL